MTFRASTPTMQVMLHLNVQEFVTLRTHKLTETSKINKYCTASLLPKLEQVRVRGEH